MKTPIDDDYIKDLAAKAQTQYDNSSDFYTQIQAERETSLKYYMQQPLGNEMKGFSQFITSDVRDTVDWYMGQLLEMFITGDTPVRFNATNAQDSGQADMETKYVNHVLLDQNKGFELFYTWFKDALISKNGVVKVWWDNKSEEVPENYEQLGYNEYMKIVNDPEYQVKELRVTSPELGGQFTPEQFAAVLAQLGEAGPIVMQTAIYDVYGCRVRDVSQVKVMNVAPEYFVVSTSQADLDLSNIDYCAHVHFYSRNELLAEGYDYETVMDLPIGNVVTNTLDSTIRYVKETGRLLNNTSATKGGELIEVIEHYIRDDGDGEPKLYCIKTAANASVILDAYEVDKVPYHVITPKINQYRFYGDSIADEVIDLQFAKSNLWRASFDNVKYSVSPRWGVRGDVDLEDANDHTPTALVRLGADGEMIPLTTPFVATTALEMAALLDGQRAERTGFSKESMGLDPSALANSTNFIGATILNLSQARLKMVASTFAHTGVKTLFLHVRELLLKYEARTKLFEYNGKYAEINPRGWVNNRSTSVKTGLGYAGKAEVTANMQNILTLQEKIVSAAGMNGPLVNAGNIYSTITRALEANGIKDVQTYFSDPANYEPPPPEPSLPELQMESYERTEMYKADVKAAVDTRKIEADVIIEKYKTDSKTKVDNEKLIFDYQRSLRADQNSDLDRTLERRKEETGEGHSE